jgi:hypothetical protein
LLLSGEYEVPANGVVMFESPSFGKEIDFVKIRVSENYI